MAVNVARIYEQTIRPGRAYCRICLRSEQETTLVQPNKILRFTQAYSFNIFENKTALAACYICEANAGTALRFYQACINAASIKEACQPLRNMKPDDPVPVWLSRAIIQCNTKLKGYRQRTSLQQTEVLVVDSSGVQFQDNINSEQTTRVSVPKTMPYSSNEAYETVVLDDDDDTPANPLAPSAGKKPLFNNFLHPHLQHRTIPITSVQTQHNPTVILQPLTFQNGQIVAPTLVNIKDGKLVLSHQDSTTGHIVVKAVTNNDTHTQTNNRYQSGGVLYIHNNEMSQKQANLQNISENMNSKVSTGSKLRNNTEETKNKRNFRKNTIQYNTNKNKESSSTFVNSADNYTDSRKANYTLGERETVHKRNFDDNSRIRNDGCSNFFQTDSAKKKKEQDCYIVDLNTVNSLISNTEDSDPIAIISNVRSTCESNDDEIGAFKEVVSQAPQPLERSGKIDWEDKIPMDVISFVRNRPRGSPGR